MNGGCGSSCVFESVDWTEAMGCVRRSCDGGTMIEVVVVGPDVCAASVALVWGSAVVPDGLDCVANVVGSEGWDCCAA